MRNVEDAGRVVEAKAHTCLMLRSRPQDGVSKHPLRLSQA